MSQVPPWVVAHVVEGLDCPGAAAEAASGRVAHGASDASQTAPARGTSKHQATKARSRGILPERASAGKHKLRIATFVPGNTASQGRIRSDVSQCCERGCMQEEPLCRDDIVELGARG